eukprot:SAG31_NODE_893_length_11177_cov_10.241806_2_plen_65_part_00
MSHVHVHLQYGRVDLARSILLNLQVPSLVRPYLQTHTCKYFFFKKIALYYGTICNTNSEEGCQK